TVAVKGKNAVAPDKTENNAFVLTKNDSGKSEIKNILTPPGLKSGETIEILHRETSPPDHSSGRVFSTGGYHHTALRSSGASTAVNESVKSQVIEPRILINQIASGVKRPGRVRITLNPPRLGTLNVDVLVRNNKVQVMLQPENNDVRQILQSNVESLKSAFRNHGLVADTINVSVQEKADSANYGANYRSGQNETLFKEGGKWGGNQEGHGTEQDSVNHDPISLKEEIPLGWSDDHGGRVSLFA
ncbi:MAG: flagellar hook-length control protein FliK, partial [Desulfobacterales bacterium]|nr:flagellar hook-length control protein FliK [Desulfobacterales bacterium]